MLTAKALSADKVLGLHVGRRRLHHQAVRPGRAAGAGQGHAAPGARRCAPCPRSPGCPATSGSRRRSSGRSARTSPSPCCTADLDNFKAYNDQKGFVRGDRAHPVVARGSSEDAVVEYAGPDGFVGHVGGDDFIAVVPPELRRGRREAALRALRRELRESLRARGRSSAGYDRDGGPQGRNCRTSRSSPSRSASPPPRSAGFAHYGEAVAVATEMKQFAKREPARRYARRPPHRRERAPARRPRPRSPAAAPILGAAKLVFGAGCDSPPAVTVRDPRQPAGVDPVRFRDRP